MSTYSVPITCVYYYNYLNYKKQGSESGNTSPNATKADDHPDGLPILWTLPSCFLQTGELNVSLNQVSKYQDI